MRTLPRDSDPIREDQRRLKFAFVLARRFTLTPFALFADVLRLAGDEGDLSRRTRIDWQVLGENGLPIEASCGARVLPTAQLDANVHYDAVVVVGGLLKHLFPMPSRMESFIAAAVERGTPLIGLCTGSFLVAELGLLDRRRASVSWFHIQEFRERYPLVEASAESLYVVDDAVSTCAGGTGAADLAAEFLRRRMHGASVESAARILLLDRLRDPRAPQPRDDLFVDARDTLVRRALLFMRSNVATVCPVSAVADRMGCTPRQLQRRFLADVGVPPSQAYMALRIDAACTLLAKTEMAVEQIGLAVGFANASMFSRAFRRMRGCTPSNFRATATSPL